MADGLPLCCYCKVDMMLLPLCPPAANKEREPKTKGAWSSSDVCQSEGWEGEWVAGGGGGGARLGGWAVRRSLRLTGYNII